MSAEISFIECPRDAWQGIDTPIPSATKALWLSSLVQAGFRHIDAVSFVSPRAVPQVADSEAVLQELGAQIGIKASGVEVIGIVMNRKGAERALATRSVTTLGFPYSLSPNFGMRNQRQTPEQSLSEIAEIRSVAESGGLQIVVYISMAFGNPYGDEWSREAIIAALHQLEDAGVWTVSLADTVGQADAPLVGEIVETIFNRFPNLTMGVHLHARYDQAEELVLAAYDAGCRRFDSAFGGFGGCPFAQDERIGNLPTEKVFTALEKRGVNIPQAAHVPELLKKWGEISSAF